MAKKKDEKDVLVVRDEKTGEISVVAGLNADGSPKRIPAKAENAQSFLQFDRHGDVLDNFFRNFFRQCREPSRFGFYRVAADQADKLLEVIKDLLKDPDGNKEMLAPHKVDTSGYEKKVQEEQSAEKQEQPEQKQDDEPKKQEEMEQKNEQNQESPQQTQGNRGYQPIDESKINWQKLEEKWGVKRDDLEKSGDLNRMLNYGKSDLVRVSPNFGGEAFELDARLSFKKDGEGNVSLVPHFIRKEQKLDEYKEHKFSDEDRKNLRETGNLGRVVDLVDRETGEIIPSFVSIDRKTNEITDVPANKVRIPERIGKTEITKQEQDMLRAGLPVRDKLIERNELSPGESSTREILDPQGKPRWRQARISFLKNRPYHQHVTEYLTLLGDEQVPEILRVRMAEALAWFNLSVRRHEIADAGRKLLARGNCSPELAKEVQRMINRVESKK